MRARSFHVKRMDGYNALYAASFTAHLWGVKARLFQYHRARVVGRLAFFTLHRDISGDEHRLEAGDTHPVLLELGFFESFWSSRVW